MIRRLERASASGMQQVQRVRGCIWIIGTYERAWTASHRAGSISARSIAVNSEWIQFTVALNRNFSSMQLHTASDSITRYFSWDGMRNGTLSHKNFYREWYLILEKYKIYVLVDAYLHIDTYSYRMSRQTGQF